MVLVRQRPDSPTRRSRSWSTTPRRIPNKLIFSSSGLYGALHLPTAAVPASRRHQDEAPADQWRRTGAHRTARQQLRRCWRRRSPPRAASRRPARCGALAYFGAKRARLAAGRADHEGARLRRRVLPVGRPVRAEGHARRRSSPSCARKPRRRSPTDQFKQAIEQHRRRGRLPRPARVRQVPGRPTPSASKARCARSASCNHDRRPGRTPGAALMILRRDHIAGGAFVAAGVFVLAVSHDLPFGTLASPGAGMLPKLVTVADDAVRLDHRAAAGGSSPPLAEISWSDLPHARQGVCRRGGHGRALYPARLHTQHDAACCSCWFMSSSGAVCSPRSPSAFRSRSSPTRLFEYLLKTPLERGMFWF